jgi:hypothetical protein
MMTRFSSRPHRTTIGYITAFTALALLALAGCDDKHIGRPCCLGAVCPPPADAAAPSPTNVSVNSEALECPSRVCILPNKQGANVDTGPFCTDNCSSDDDCADGEKRDPSDPTDKRCQGGFVCRVVVPNLMNVAKSCQKVCTCKDFLSNSSPTVPMGC